LQMC